MKKPLKKFAYARCAGKLVIVALLATLARWIYYALYWGNMAWRSLE